MSSGSVNFDVAADYYDGTRAEGPQTQARVMDLLRSELDGRGRCLEIGVGTGRVGLPLAGSGVPLVGVDISPRMVARLVEKAGGTIPFPLALADATALPFPEGAFGGALAAHVFHLIPPWREALRELRRVVRPGGVLLVSLTGGRLDPLHELRDRFVAAAGIERAHVGVREPAELRAALEELGAVARDLPPINEERPVRPEDVIGRFERGEFSWTWPIAEQTRRRAADEVRRWAREAYGSLDVPRLTQRAVTWYAYDFPGRAP
ncbi:MAG TPA: class I SAM-dependent methyltransferase [Actinomycetota bacterium]|nr:class I SAM-dependent methyltransferase [Actinomycetota bacterium]